MDDILDLLQDATETMSLYDVRAHDRGGAPARRHQRALLRAGAACGVAAAEHQPAGDVAEAAIKTCEEIDRLESDADRVMRAAMSKLFREEKDVRELIKLKTIYEQLESISDRCEDVANLIEGVVLENS